MSAANTGTPGGGEALGQHLQRHRLAGAGGTGDEAVPVGELQLQAFRPRAALAEEDLALLQQLLALAHGSLPTLVFVRL